MSAKETLFRFPLGNPAQTGRLRPYRVGRALTLTNPSPLAAETPPSAVAGDKDENRRGQREIEIKLITSPEGLAAALGSPLLRAAANAPAGRKLASVYFDTPQGDLRSNRMSLRVRRSGRSAPVMTLKWPVDPGEGAFARGEIEMPVPKLQPDLSLLQGEIAERLRALVGDRTLAPIYETRVWRITRLIGHGAARIEVAFDEGVILVGERSAPLCEVELELKAGPTRDLYEFAAKLAESLPLVVDIVSKAERAHYFACAEAPVPVKARPVELPGEVLDEAIARIIASACAHFVANWAPLRGGDDPEAIHQMRVALRRLRAALAMFLRAAPSSEFEHFRQEAKALATALGPARDCDALRELVETGPHEHFGETQDFSTLLDAIEARRSEAYAEARALLADSRPTIFLMKLSAYVARRGWREALSGENLGILSEPVDIFAAQALERLYRRVLKRGKNLASLPDDARHQTRIALKNLRYGAEFFAPCFADARDPASFVKAAAQLQGLLGAHNDAASADHFLSQNLETEAARAAGLVTGWYARGAVIADGKLAKAWKNFKRIKPFWR
jgi:inorganic triphosphatase YgiF